MDGISGNSTHKQRIYRVKDSPQEQEREAKGLLNTNPVRTIVCSKSISEPLINI